MCHKELEGKALTIGSLQRQNNGAVFNANTLSRHLLDPLDVRSQAPDPLFRTGGAWVVVSVIFASTALSAARGWPDNDCGCRWWGHGCRSGIRRWYDERLPTQSRRCSSPASGILTIGRTLVSGLRGIENYTHAWNWEALETALETIGHSGLKAQLLRAVRAAAPRTGAVGKPVALRHA
jgi:hypothetical protein